MHKLDHIDYDSSDLKPFEGDDSPLRHRGLIPCFMPVAIFIFIDRSASGSGRCVEIISVPQGPSTLLQLRNTVCCSYHDLLPDLTSFSTSPRRHPAFVWAHSIQWSFMKLNIFRGPAGPEVDAAWRSLGIDYRPILRSPSMAAKSGILPHQVRVSAKYGGGYLAGVQGLHHLHCLNLLRQALWYNFEYYNETRQGSFNNKPEMVQLHISRLTCAF